MTKLLEQAVETVRRLPAADQDTIAEAMLGLARVGAAEDIDPEHLEDVLAGLAEIERASWPRRKRSRPPSAVSSDEARSLSARNPAPARDC
ncbi:hypothetical protein [Methylorubrum aminovorans]|uniref:hypothetical protein n=1 Tax=Methylorubrum aminovorans TaxID=269069 RepID=UPI0024E180D0|nr:hypothetical protein [Methylorubrum aminovorans]